MAGRNYLPPDALTLRDGDRDSRLIHRLPPPESQTRLQLEDRVALQRRHIQTLVHENQRFATTVVDLQRQFSAAQQDLRLLTAAASTIKAECDAQVREVFESSIRTEAEIRPVDGFGVGLAQVRDDIEKMIADRNDLTAKLKGIEDELATVRPELKQLKAVKTEISTMQKEIKKGRAAIEYEKKIQTVNHEQSEIMEKNMMSMSCEIERLRADLANAENRARAVAAVATPSPAYPAGYGIPASGHGGNLYPSPYAVQQVQPSTDAGTGYGGVHYNPYAPYDMQPPHVS